MQQFWNCLARVDAADSYRANCDGAETVKMRVEGACRYRRIVDLGELAHSSKCTCLFRSVEASATAPTQQGGANRAVVVMAGERPFDCRHGRTGWPGDLRQSGKRIGSTDAGEAVGVDVRYGALTGLGVVAVIVAADARANSLRFLSVARRQSLSEVSARPVPLGIAVEGACLSRSSQDGSLYAFALGDGGEVDQYLLFRRLRAASMRAGQDGCTCLPRPSIASPTTRPGNFMYRNRRSGFGASMPSPKPKSAYPDRCGAARPDYRRGRRDRAVQRRRGRAMAARVERVGGPDSTSTTTPRMMPMLEPSASRPAARQWRAGRALRDQLCARRANGALLIGDDEAEFELQGRAVRQDRRIDSELSARDGATADPALSPRRSRLSVRLSRPLRSPMRGDAADDPAIWANPDGPGQRA